MMRHLNELWQSLEATTGSPLRRFHTLSIILSKFDNFQNYSLVSYLWFIMLLLWLFIMVYYRKAGLIYSAPQESKDFENYVNSLKVRFG